mmetsp:Transcript_26097/g.29212  ORF Transcript_26097/g.29212 Transcript_26097/m.29212 type:complete len:212 (+) Transcript_26097:2365-3000(+)
MIRLQSVVETTSLGRDSRRYNERIVPQEHRDVIHELSLVVPFKIKVEVMTREAQTKRPTLLILHITVHRKVVVLRVATMNMRLGPDISQAVLATDDINVGFMDHARLLVTIPKGPVTCGSEITTRVITRRGHCSTLFLETTGPRGDGFQQTIGIIELAAGAVTRGRPVLHFSQQHIGMLLELDHGKGFLAGRLAQGLVGQTTLLWRHVPKA